AKRMSAYGRGHGSAGARTQSRIHSNRLDEACRNAQSPSVRIPAKLLNAHFSGAESVARSQEIETTRRMIMGTIAGLATCATLTRQPSARSSEKFTVEGQRIDKRPPELETDHPVFPGQTHAPYHKTTAVAATTLAGGLDNPWAVALLPSGRFLITEK